jgi:hypothetical protein
MIGGSELPGADQDEDEGEGEGQGAGHQPDFRRTRRDGGVWGEGGGEVCGNLSGANWEQTNSN